MNSPKRGVRMALSLSLALSGCEACGDDEHKGTISHGTTSPSASAKPVETTRLTYNPGSPLHTMRVAEIFKKRLEPLGIDATAIKIGGDIVNIDVPNATIDAAKRALEGGRLDVYLIDDDHDPFSKNEADHSEKFALGTDAARFLWAPPEQRDALVDYVQQYAGSKKVLTGPYATADVPAGVRAYFVHADKSARGEFLESARGEGSSLSLTFSGSAKSSIQWNTKEPSRYAALVDGVVVGVAAPEEQVKDGTLQVSLADASADGAAIAKSLDGIAVSHDTVAEEKASK